MLASSELQWRCRSAAKIVIRAQACACSVQGAPVRSGSGDEVDALRCKGYEHIAIADGEDALLCCLAAVCCADAQAGAAS